MPEPISILYTIPNFITAGSGRVMLNIIERLDRERFAPAVCVARKGGALDAEVERLGLPFIEADYLVPAHPYASLFSRARQQARVFQPHNFDLWHSFDYRDDYTEPIIARMAGAKGWIYTKKAMGWGSRAWLLRSYLATRIVADNTEMPRRMFARPGLRNKVRVIHHGLPTDQFVPDIEPRLGLRQELSLSEQTPLAGCVAHLVPVKGHPTLLRALAQAPGVHLLIAGKPMDAEYAASLKHLACELNIEERVHFLGGVSDVPALLSEVDIAALPTWAKWRMEGCPVALLEAMSCGCACIATDIPGSRDLVEHEKSGLIVPPENIEALAEALRRLAASPEERKKIGDAARARVLDKFRIEQEVAAHEALYTEILKR